MAISIRGLLRHNFKFLNNNMLKPVSSNVTRCLYTPSALAVDSYIEVRKHISSQFQTVSQTFRAKMLEFTNEDNKSLIFTEDLKAMLHIVENNEQDIDLILKMIKKFNAQSNELRFGNYVFGPVVMRAFYFLNVPDIAFQTFKDPELGGFFEQLSSYQILLTLLYDHGKYAEMREAYDIIRNKSTNGVQQPHNSILLVLAACYKENTKESFDYALALWKEMNIKGIQPHRKSFCFIAALALKQGKPEFALELISFCSRFRHIDVRCIKIEGFVALNRLDNVLQFLQKILHSERFIKGTTKPIGFFEDTIMHLQEAIDKAGPEQHAELVRLLEELKSQDLVQNITLETSLLRPMEKRAGQNRNDPSSMRNDRENSRGFQQRRIGMNY